MDLDFIRSLVAMQLADRDPGQVARDVAKLVEDWITAQHAAAGTTPPKGIRIVSIGHDGRSTASATMPVRQVVHGLVAALLAQYLDADVSVDDMHSNGASFAAQQLAAFDPRPQLNW